MSFLRPVAREVNEVIGPLPQGPFNYGLFFHKWFYVSSQTWKCHTEERKRDDSLSLLQNLPISLGLFNKGSITVGLEKGNWLCDNAAALLKQKHARLDNCAQSFQKLGYRYCCFRAVLQSPLVLGLGGAHPTEKGFRFDWNLGLPMIPASGIKGVVRLAFLVNALRESREEFEEKYGGPEWEKVRDKGILPEPASSFFGSGGEKKDEARRGKVIFLDAYPASLPRLKAEIMNCHYPDYLNPGEQNKRGPTEDQRPNPQKFWAVDPEVKKDEPLQFIFRIMHRDLSETQQDSLEKALRAALEEHGLGAKTAIGHGRFGRPGACDGGKAEAATNPLPSEKAPTAGPGEGPAPALKPTAPPLEVWDRATLTWSPGNRTLTATGPTAKATVMGSDLLPPGLQPRLLKKHKAVVARVMVERVGNAFRIVRVEPAD